MTILKGIGFSILALLFGAGGSVLGGTYSQSAQYFAPGLFAGSSNQFSVEADGDVLTTAGVRSDKSTFCWDFYATSTATRMKMTASSTATIEGVDGVMVASYGACP